MEQKLNALYDQLLNHSKEMSITEYSQKRAIFEFLKRLDDDGKGKNGIQQGSSKNWFS